MSTQPLLGSNHASRESKSSEAMAALSTVFGGGIFDMGSSTSYDGICLMLNAEERDERDELTKNWRDHKIQELNFVGTVGALLAGCLSSTGAWPDVLDNGRSKPWTVRACWHGGLVFALFAVLVAGQQSMRLHRLSSHRDGLQHIRECLARRKSSSNDEYRPHKIQVYAWDASILFLVVSVLCMIAGLAVLLWVSTEYGPDKKEEDGWWDENSKLAVSFTAVLGVSLLVFIGAQSALVGNKKK